MTNPSILNKARLHKPRTDNKSAAVAKRPDYEQLTSAEQAVTEALNFFVLPFGDNLPIKALDSDSPSEVAQLASWKRLLIKQASHIPSHANVPLENTVDGFLSWVGLSSKEQLRQEVSRQLVSTLSEAASRAAGVHEIG